MTDKKTANTEAPVEHLSLFIYKVSNGFMIPIADSANHSFKFKIFTSMEELYNYLDVYFTLQ